MAPGEQPKRLTTDQCRAKATPLPRVSRGEYVPGLFERRWVCKNFLGLSVSEH